MRILITAGPTREPIDPVRYLTNRSSGKMGYALAEAAAAQGHEVTLISGPTSLRSPDGVRCFQVESARQMRDCVAEHLRGMDAAIFAAAVADYRPVNCHPQKIKKSEGRLTLEFERTPDILGSARSEMQFGGVLIGFAAETENLAANAALKLQHKGCDLIVANDVSKSGIGFDSDDNEVTLVYPGDRTETLSKMPKRLLAERLITTAVELAKSRPS